MPQQESLSQEDLADDQQDGAWDHDAEHDAASGTPSPHEEDDAAGADGQGSAPKPAVPMQKRRRVTRACDECRRKKIKCDGKQPCTHCTVYSYDCTYDQPSNRRRNPVPAYVEALEARVHRAESLIQMIAPNLDLNDPALDIAIRHGYIPGLKSSMPSAPQDVKADVAALGGRNANTQDQAEVKVEADLESMVQAVGRIDLDESGNWDYHGHSSGLIFMKRMREQLGEIMGPDTGSTPFVKDLPASSILDSPRSISMGSPTEMISPTSDLPPEALAREICGHVINSFTALLKVVHAPTFWKSFQRIYTLPTDQFANEDHKFCPLLYSTLALGHVWGGRETGNYENAIDKGYKYFRAARKMMDIADVRDLTSLQALVLMISFLQTSAKLSQCYSYIGVASRAAVRLGLHRSLPPDSFGPVEAELRKRIFWTIRKMDIYVGSILGLPQSMHDDDIDQDQPLEVDDDCLSDQGIKLMPAGGVSLMTAFNMHTKLTFILAKIVKVIYPIRPQNVSLNNSYTVPFSKIKEIEQDLENWKASLPPAFDPSNNDPKLLRTQQNLRLTYAFNQILLYRPFLHFVASDKRSKQTDQRAYACAASYINVSRNLIHICELQHKKGLLTGSMWFNMYTTFFAIISLVYFAAENQDNPMTQDLMKDALNGRGILATLAKHNKSADRCTSTLDEIFKRLPEWMQEGKANPVPKRKRKQNTEQKQTSTATQVHTLNRTGSIPAFDQVRGVSPAQVNTSGAFTQQGNGFPSAPYTPSDYSPTTQTLQQFGLQPDASTTGDINDLSSMIFSAAEPFTYPNQPLMTFESRQGNKDSSLFDPNNMSDMSMMAQPNSSQPNDDQLEAQLYALPPFMMQGTQWPSGMQAANQNGQIGGVRQGHDQARRQTQQQQQQQRQQAQFILQRQGNGFQQQQQRQQRPDGSANWQDQQNALYGDPAFGDINLNEIFGTTEWNGHMMGQGGYGP